MQQFSPVSKTVSKFYRGNKHQAVFCISTIFSNILPLRLFITESYVKLNKYVA